ncbi:hypothetical protein B0H66DRAFT_528859 [Apodospora peruviana]|uniref:Zn(2)-C6 fungal-type domain-containing protein n=1 Tax=Apodospora peruviana TaxID=516989 RepID=A0AAE0IV55_9PEZI|nr:hypothetical protein B0H66DRAFT_528859 [Apodospora peruviana]
MNHDNSPPAEVQDQLPACYRCHASKVRCRRVPRQVRCRRCTRAAYSDYHPRPSRRGHGRIGQRQQRRGPSGTSTSPEEAGEEDSLPEPPAVVARNMTAEPRHDLYEQRGHDMDAADPSHTHLDLMAISMTPGGGDDLAGSLWTPFVSDFDPDSLLYPRGTLTTATPSQPSASSSGSVSPVDSESLREDSVTVSPALSSSRNKACDRAGSRGSERPERLCPASYMQALGDLNVQMLSQQQPESIMLECICQKLRYPQHGPFPFSEEGPVEVVLRLGLALRSLLRPNQTDQCDMPTALFLLSTVLRLASLLHDLVARLQDMLFAVKQMFSSWLPR